MYFLDGDRIYIKPERACSTLEEQVESCCVKLLKINSGKRIFKLNFFVDTESDEAYAGLRSRVKKRITELFSENIILSFIAQPPLTCKIIVEALYYDPEIWEMKTISDGENGAAVFSNHKMQILVGNVHTNREACCKLSSEQAFGALNEVLENADFGIGNIIRQWNYLENILGFDGNEQRYQAFNDVRSHYYGSVFEKNGYPAATGIGMNRGGVIIEFVAVKGKGFVTRPVDNPGQISAHNYSENVLVGEECSVKTTPKFERARYFNYEDKKLIFISGTASITGELTVGVGDPVHQTEVTIQNIQRLYSDEVLQNLSDEKLEAKYGHARVYVKNRKDFHPIRKTFKKHFGNLPVVYIIADICRTDLLVEIEGKVILE
ncbi:hypothetical protein [Maribellus sp. YY47]|uniref:chorismate transformation enzyme, FkbO/Hyg5 family n=1 Tax=Maribellus sp. YY47 TaxID=2929486 RepID=UPI00200130A2|nr:hypothetical protein [Maribellus sp. YY47]MCK3685709.1 hypothetical protein [Maribellus sp. YY47]